MRMRPSPDLVLAKPRAKENLTEFQRQELLTGWQQSALGTLDEIELRRRAGTLTPRDWKDLTIAGGVSTEKVLLISGQPTSITANLHAVRVDLLPLMDKLMGVKRTIDVEVSPK